MRLVIESAAGSPENHAPALLKVVARALRWFQELELHRSSTLRGATAFPTALSASFSRLRS
jgi:hypothetical protein